RGCHVTDTSTAGFAEALGIARRSDIAVVVLGETQDMSGEASSRSTLGLPGVQEQLLETVARTGTPVALVLMNGRPLALPWAAEHVPAIVETWFLGVETVHAVTCSAAHGNARGLPFISTRDRKSTRLNSSHQI